MVLTNELIRSSVKEQPYIYKKTTAINSGEKLKTKCTWHCHNDTGFCKNNHVKKAGYLFKITDPMHFGIIHFLKSTGHYALANIILFVILFPLLIFYFLVKIIEIQSKINLLKN